MSTPSAANRAATARVSASATPARRSRRHDVEVGDPADARRRAAGRGPSRRRRRPARRPSRARTRRSRGSRRARSRDRPPRAPAAAPRPRTPARAPRAPGGRRAVALRTVIRATSPLRAACDRRCCARARIVLPPRVPPSRRDLCPNRRRTTPPCARRGRRPARRRAVRAPARGTSRRVQRPRPRCAVIASITSVVGQVRERGEVEVAARERRHVLGLAGREADLADLALGGRGDALPGRERPRAPVADAEALDQPRTDGERGVERHLLRRDQRHEHLPADRRRAVAGSRPAAPRSARQRGLGRRPGPEALEIERRAEQPARLAPRSHRRTARPSTPPGAASSRTSRPAMTRCRPPSCQRFARSAPYERNRSVDATKSYGCGRARRAMPRSYARGRPRVSVGERAADVVQVLEGLVRRRPARRGTARGRRARTRAPPRARRSGRRCRRRRRRTGSIPASATRLHGSPQTSHGSRSRKTDRQPAGSASSRLATTAATTPSRSSTGSISSWKPAEMISGSWAATSSAQSRAARRPCRAASRAPRRTAPRSSPSRSRSPRSASARGRSAASSARKTSRSPKRSIAMWRVSRSVTVPSQSRTSRISRSGTRACRCPRPRAARRPRPRRARRPEARR